jgi:hypothetical protein
MSLGTREIRWRNGLLSALPAGQHATNTFSLFRSLVIYAICLPLAVWLGCYEVLHPAFHRRA